jgi:hypothetical protein
MVFFAEVKMFEKLSFQTFESLTAKKVFFAEVKMFEKLSFSERKDHFQNT